MSNDFSEIVKKVSKLQDLRYDEMTTAMEFLLSPQCETRQKAEFLMHLSKKGESNHELGAMLDKMNEYAVQIRPKTRGNMIDVCGTGGDNMKTFNVSTATAFVVAGAGGTVAKHGNRSSSGACGSADVFEYFGYDLEMDPGQVKRAIETVGIGFMFAQKFHPAMKNVAMARKELGQKTAFNLLGPLCNPAGVKHQLVGVYSKEFLERIIVLLKNRGALGVMTVLSSDGLDEISPFAKNHICQLKEDDKTESSVLDPRNFGMGQTRLSDICVFSKEQAIDAFLQVLQVTSNKARKEIVVLNSAAALIVLGLADDFEKGIEIATDTLENGKAYKKFEQLVFKFGNKQLLDSPLSEKA